MKTYVWRYVIVLLAALSLLSTVAHSTVFVSSHAPGMCLGNNNGVADIDYCGPDNNVVFNNNYGTIQLRGLCLGTDGSNPEGRGLRWETCRVKATASARDPCRNEPDQCWKLQTSGQLNNEQGWAADVEGQSRSNGARVIAYKYSGGNNQNWGEGFLSTTVDAYASSANLNIVGKAQLKAFDTYVSSNRASIVASGGGNVIATGSGKLVVAGEGNFVHVVMGNIVAAGAGNIVSGGAGNIVSGGADNIIAAGAGNLVNLNAATLTRLGGGQQFITRVASLVGNDGAGLVGMDSASLVPSLASYFSKVNGLVLATDAAKLVAAGGGNLVAAGSLNFTANDVMSMMRSAQSMTGSRSLMAATDLPATLNTDMLAALLRIKTKAEPVFAKYERMLGASTPISQDARTRATQLRDMLQALVTRNRAITNQEEASAIQQIQIVDNALSAPVVVTPPPPPPVAPRPQLPPPPPPPAPVTTNPNAAPATLAAGPCGDAWVNDTVSKTLNRAARGSGKNVGECNIGRYGGGAWSDYADLLRKTQAAYSVCSDRSVSAAVWEALGRAPQGSGTTNDDCNHARYNSGSWSSYDALVNMVRLAATANAPVLPAPAAQARTISVRSTHAPGKCLDVSANQGILLWDCHGGANQRFSQEADGSIKYNGQCLANSGNTLRFESCAGSGAIHQKWRVVNGAAQNSNVPPSCIDIENGSKNNGARLLAWQCQGSGNQQWSFAQ